MTNLCIVYMFLPQKTVRDMEEEIRKEEVAGGGTDGQEGGDAQEDSVLLARARAENSALKAEVARLRSEIAELREK